MKERASGLGAACTGACERDPSPASPQKLPGRALALPLMSELREVTSWFLDKGRTCV